MKKKMHPANLKFSLRSEKNKPHTPALTFAWAEENLAFWDEWRRRRDMPGTGLEENEALLDELEASCGSLTDSELIHSWMNSVERRAREDIQSWCDSIGAVDSPDSVSDRKNNLRRSDLCELYRVYEEWRAVVATGNKSLIRLWLSEQSFPVRLVVIGLFVERQNPK